MKKIKIFLLLTFIFTFCVMSVFADNTADVKKFFDEYINSANTYKDNLPSYYSANAKILRYVILPDGKVYPTPLVVGTKDYMGQLKLNAKIAKLRNYKNYYNNIVIKQIGNDYKITATRTPSPSPNDKMQAYFVIGKDASGKYVIKEEMMQTRQQIFLSQIKKQQRKK